MSINYATKYEKKIDERFKVGPLSAPAVNTDYDFTGVSTVTVYSIPTVALGDYALTGSNRYGTPGELQNSKQDLTLTRDRAFTFTIDRRSYADTMMVMEAGKALAREIDEVVIPEIDKYRLAKLVANAAHTGDADITPANAYSAFLDGVNALTDGLAPTAGRIAFVTPAFFKSVKLDASFIKSGDLAQTMLLKGQLGAIDGIPLILVPTNYLPARTQFLITHPVAATSPVKLAEYKVHDNPPGINGWLVEGRFYYDCFVLNNKKAAIYAHVTAEPAGD
jgi:N4-gp56 family major capsid protein